MTRAFSSRNGLRSLIGQLRRGQLRRGQLRRGQLRRAAARATPRDDGVFSVGRGVDIVASYFIGVPRYYPEGWGDRDLIQQIGAQVRSIDVHEPIAPIHVRWEGPARAKRGAVVRYGLFESPALQILPLPPASRAARFELLLPRRGHTGSICVFLAATGDQGFATRGRLAMPLVRAGMGALILENPFYGTRRPDGQFWTALRCVSDQFIMNLATVMEAKSVLGWLESQGYGPLGVTGYSQGGYMAAFTAAVTRLPLAAIPCAAGSSSTRAFTELRLSRFLSWPTLQSELGAAVDAKEYFAAALEPIEVRNLPPPVSPQASIIVAGLRDGFVEPDTVRSLHEHWRGSELRWLPGGHATTYILHQASLRAAIGDAMERVDSAASA